jgi:hypothetical protein
VPALVTMAEKSMIQIPFGGLECAFPAMRRSDFDRRCSFRPRFVPRTKYIIVGVGCARVCCGMRGEGGGII